MGEENSDHEKSNVWKKTEWAGLICIFFILMVLIHMLWNSGADGEMADIRSVNSGWYQIVDEKEEALDLPAMVKADQDGKIMLYNNTLTPEDKNKVLSINGLQDQPEVWMGKQCLFWYEENDFLKNDQMKGKMWADVWLAEDTGKEPVCLVYESNNRASLYIQAPVLGSCPAVSQKHFQESVFSFLMILGMWGTGMVSTIVFWYMKAHHIVEKRFLDASLFMFICGLWCYLDSGFYQMYGEHGAVGMVLSFYAFILMSVPMLWFVQNTISEKVRWVPQVWIFLLYGNAILQGILNILFHIPFVHMLFLTHIMLFFGVISMICLLWKEYKRSEAEELLFCLRAFATLGVSGVTALILYWVYSIYWYDMVFQAGIFLYTSILFWHLLQKTSRDSQFRMEQLVYEKMSMEDRMTGLKNRKAFEKYIKEIQEGKLRLENAMLLFIEITGLKQINDIYGMKTGDEAVIQTARCIQKAADSDQRHKIESFRIGGTEFAVIVMDPQIQPQELECLLENEVKKETENRYYISLQFGYGYLKNEDGMRNTVSDWKRQADHMLQRTKGAIYDDV